MNESTIAMFEGDEEIRRLLEMRDGPCDNCEIGEYKHVGTNPGYRESTIIYECNNCGHTVSFP